MKKHDSVSSEKTLLLSPREDLNKNGSDIGRSSHFICSDSSCSELQREKQLNGPPKAEI